MDLSTIIDLIGLPVVVGGLVGWVGNWCRGNSPRGATRNIVSFLLVALVGVISYLVIINEPDILIAAPKIIIGLASMILFAMIEHNSNNRPADGSTDDWLNHL